MGDLDDDEMLKELDEFDLPSANVEMVAVGEPAATKTQLTAPVSPLATQAALYNDILS